RDAALECACGALAVRCLPAPTRRPREPPSFPYTTLSRPKQGRRRHFLPVEKGQQSRLVHRGRGDHLLWQGVHLAAEPKPRCTSRSEEHTSELQSLTHLVCRLLLVQKKSYVMCSVCPTYRC